MAKLLATDLDGTLFYPKQIKTCIPQNNINFLQKWIDEGNSLVLISSRSLQFLRKIKDEIDRPFDVIACSSSQIVVNNKLIRNESISNKDLKTVIDLLDKKYKPIGYLMTTRNYPCIIKNNRGLSKLFVFFYEIYWKLLGIYREPYILSNKIFNRELNDGEIYKLIIFFGFGRKKRLFTKELNKELINKFPNVEFSWVGTVNEITSKKCSKGDGLDFYCKYKKIDPKDVVVVGDSGNDISMFKKYHENSFIMKHASKNIKKYAAHEVSKVYNLEDYFFKKEKK